MMRAGLIMVRPLVGLAFRQGAALGTYIPETTRVGKALEFALSVSYIDPVTVLIDLPSMDQHVPT